MGKALMLGATSAVYNYPCRTSCRIQSCRRTTHGALCGFAGVFAPERDIGPGDTRYCYHLGVALHDRLLSAKNPVRRASKWKTPGGCELSNAA